MAESVVEQVAAMVQDVRADLARIGRDELRAADAAGELGILVGALERVVARLEERLGQLGGVPAPAARPSGAAPPATPPAESAAGARPERAAGPEPAGEA